MADTNHSLRRKTRSASICAPGSSSMEQMLGTMPPLGKDREKKKDRESGSATPENNTPTRRRKPATRSQSARVSGANKSIRRRAAAQAASHHDYPAEGSVKSPHCISEPRLSENDVSPRLRRRGSRRGQSVHHAHHRKVNPYLDVPDVCSHPLPRDDILDEDIYRLRSFSLTSKGVINRGDSFRKKRSRSNSLAPAEGEVEESKNVPPKDVITYTVAILGCRGVGKSALISQFMSSEGINAYDRQRDAPSESSVFLMLNGEESELRFVDITNLKELEKNPPPHAFVIMYSVIDKASFQRAEDLLSRLHDLEHYRGRPVILVGNKIDVVRSRVVSSQDGKCMACTYRAKFAEISVGINHNVDDLLVGILSQIRLKVSQGQLEYKAGSSGGGEHGEHWYKSRGVVRASMKARQMLTWLFGKEDRKFKNCENLHVL